MTERRARRGGWWTAARAVVPALLGLVALVAAVAGCGVPEDAVPRPIEPKSVPFNLLSPDAGASSTTTTLPQGATSPVTVFLVDDKGQLVETQREVAGTPTAGRAVRALLAEPSQAELNRGLTSAITEGTRLREVTVADSTATVDLTSNLLEVRGRRQIQAVAQVVYTVTAVANVERVFLRFDGEARDVPRGDGQLTAAPLTRSDFRALVAPAR